MGRPKPNFAALLLWRNKKRLPAEVNRRFFPNPLKAISGSLIGQTPSELNQNPLFCAEEGVKLFSPLEFSAVCGRRSGSAEIGRRCAGGKARVVGGS
jgi:hypothetical protein